MKNKKLFSIPILLAIVLVGSVLSLNVQNTPIVTPSATFNLVSGPCVKVEQNGVWKDLGCYHNLITNLGRDLFEGAAGTGATINFTQMVASNCTNGVTVTDTSICNNQAWTGCGLSAVSNATYVAQGTGMWNITYQWTTNTCNDINVSACGIANQTGANQLAFEAVFSPTMLQGSTGDKLNCTWGFVLS